MSQQRQCCCGPEQNFELECLASDKIFPFGFSENTAVGDRRGSNNDYVSAPDRSGLYLGQQQFHKSRGQGRLRPLQASSINVFSRGKDPTGNYLKTRDPNNTTGMGCMLCHGTLIMSTKLPSHSARAFGAVSDFCGEDTACNASTKGLGIRTFGGDSPSFFGCFSRRMQHEPITTDADYMSYPELTACTNPANVMFDDLNISGCASSLRSAFNAWQTGVDNNEPEYANHRTVLNDAGQAIGVDGNWLCTFNGSNINPWVTIYSGSNPNFSSKPPCGGNFMPGISSWQAYQLRSDPELRSLGDAMSYGNGAPLFSSPSSMIDQNLAPYSNSVAYAPLANAMLGTLHRVRLWMRADQVTIDGE